MPGGNNAPLNQVLLQAPDVAQDSFGQIHVRGDHNDLQYRLNGIILPEGISVFSQTLSPWLISSLKLITGALPAEYGLRTAGIIDLSTNSGLLQPGGEVSVYGGSHSTYQPSAEYGGSDGNFTYYVTGDYKQDNLGIESPDGSSNPMHDHTTQYHGFSYLEDIIDSDNRVSLILGISDDEFQIPNQEGLQPCAGLRRSTGNTAFLSNDLNEHQHELAEYAIASWQHSKVRSTGRPRFRARYTSLHFAPDWVGDLLCSTASPRTPSRTTPPSAGKPMRPTSSTTRTRCARGSIFSTTIPRSDTTSQVAAHQCEPACRPPRCRSTIVDNGHPGAADRERVSAG